MSICHQSAFGRAVIPPWGGERITLVHTYLSGKVPKTKFRSISFFEIKNTPVCIINMQLKTEGHKEPGSVRLSVSIRNTCVKLS